MERVLGARVLVLCQLETLEPFQLSYHYTDEIYIVNMLYMYMNNAMLLVGMKQHMQAV